ncbi:hypothetical protein DFH09DRAFT_901433 [Mycena vulgaris]|nr:hypothetical protein DFH09DRAFT_901433 [Mycena vulgaris]
MSNLSTTSQESVLPDNSTQASTPGLRTLEDVRHQVAVEVAIRAINAAESVDGVRLGVALTLSKSDDEAFLRRVAGVIAHQLLLTQHLFALASTGPDQNTLLLTGSPPTHVQRALLLVTAALPTRISSSYTAPDGSLFTARVQYITPADEPTLLRALRQAVALDTRAPPPGSRGVEQLLADARRGVRRLTPREAFDAVRGAGAGEEPTFIVDIRAAPRRGGITGSLLVDRNDLEWAFDPRLAASPYIASTRLLISSSFAIRPILICADGRASSLAAHSLRQLGLYNATDVVGGWAAWVREFGEHGELHEGDFE